MSTLAPEDTATEWVQMSAAEPPPLSRADRHLLERLRTMESNRQMDAETIQALRKENARLMSENDRWAKGFGEQAILLNGAEAEVATLKGTIHLLEKAGR